MCCFFFVIRAQEETNRTLGICFERQTQERPEPDTETYVPVPVFDVCEHLEKKSFFRCVLWYIVEYKFRQKWIDEIFLYLVHGFKCGQKWNVDFFYLVHGFKCRQKLIVEKLFHLDHGIKIRFANCVYLTFFKLNTENVLSDYVRAIHVLTFIRKGQCKMFEVKTVSDIRTVWEQLYVYKITTKMYLNVWKNHYIFESRFICSMPFFMRKILLSLLFWIVFLFYWFIKPHSYYFAYFLSNENIYSTCWKSFLFRFLP